MKLEPVVGNPFESAVAPPSLGPTLEPVEGDPFAGAAPAASAAPAGLEPVEGNPFGAPGGSRRATFGEALGRATQGTLASVGGAVEAVGEATGSPTLTQAGGETRRQYSEAAKQYPAPQEFLKIQNAADALQWAKETTAELIPQAGPSLVGAAGGAALGSPLGPIGATIGGITGALVPSLVLNTGEVQSKLKEKGGEAASAPGTVLGAGAAVASLDAITPFRLGSKLVSRFGIEVAEQIAEKALLKRTAQEAGKSASVEGVTEALQEAMGEVATSGALDKTVDLPGLGVQMVEAGAKGAFGGGLMGGGAAAIQRPTAEIQGARPASPEAVQQTFETAVREPPASSVRVEEGTTPPSEIASASSEAAPTAAAPAPTFYSTVRKVAEERLPSSATAEQILATLRNAPGVKEEELQALGLDSWLAEQKGKVSKVDLVAEIEANAVQVQDVLHAEAALPTIRWGNDLTARGDRVFVAENAPGWQIVERTLPMRVSDPAQGGIQYEVQNPAGQTLGRFGNLEVAQGRVARFVQGPATTQYRDYTLPGGENYRELLLTLPAATPEEKLAVALGGGRRGVDSSVVYRSPHFDEANIVAHTRLTDRTDAEGRKVLFVEEIQSDWHQEGRRKGYGKSTVPRGWADTASSTSGDKVPDAPFKTSWPELVVKRLLRMAADEGYERIAFINGAAQQARYGLAETAAKGQKEFYDSIVPRIVEKWARKLGTKTGETALSLETPSDRNDLSFLARFIEVPLSAAQKIQQGLPLFSRLGAANEVQVDGSGIRGSEAEGFSADGKVDLRPVVRQAGQAIAALAKSMKLDKPITIRMLSRANGRTLGEVHTLRGTDGAIRGYRIDVTLPYHTNAAAVYATLAHEFGHVVKTERFDSAPALTQLGLVTAYEKFRTDARQFEKLRDAITQRDNFISAYFNVRRIGEQNLLNMAPEQRQYWLGFEEWFAEQVAKWMTTDEKPLNFVDRFFSALGKQIREIYAAFRMKFGLAARPEQLVADWLNSLIEEPQLGVFDTMARMEERTKAAAAAALRRDGAPHFPAEAQQAATSFPRAMLEKLGLAELPEAKSITAQADRFNKFYQWMLSMVQIADRNPHILPLARYRELWQLKQLERARIMDESLTTLKAWRRLGEAQADKLAGFIDDYMNLKFLPKAELEKGVSRRPTAEEFAALVKRHGVTTDGLTVFQRIVSDFDRMLDRYGEILQAEAARITDPVRQAEALEGARETIERLRKQPYFPAMRFGDYTLTVRNAAGQVVHFETFETTRKRNAAAREIRPRLRDGETLQQGALAKDARPLVGMPSGLLDRIGGKLDLSPTQRQALDQLRFEMAPVQSFRHRFQTKNRVAGYSSDFIRAYANYFFHGSNYFTNVKYVDAMRDQVALVRTSARELLDGTKRGQIANFLSDHLAYMMDPKPDFAALRSAMFFWALGWSPAAATLNLTQMLVGSTPFLSSKYGDLRTMKAMLQAGGSVGTYYRKATLAASSERDMRAISEGVKQGVITEALAPELAAISDGRNLGKGFGGNAAERGWSHFMTGAAWMFSMTEQMNRRITFRAAWQLALENPAAKYVSESVTKHNLEFQRLREAGWVETEAAAFVAAKDAVESTQFIYQKYAQPRFMRGRLGAVFVFKSFLQNTLFMLWNYPSAAVRSMLIMAFLGGLMGIPGAEDIRGLLKALAWQLFGKDFDLEHEARKFALDVLEGKIAPDILLHGISRRGFGIPAVMDSVGVPLPVFDRSKAVGLGSILPVDVGALAGPAVSRDQNRVIAQQAQQASGAAFGTFFNIYKALTDGQLSATDLKRWERAMPRAMGNASKAWRAYSEGGERSRVGNTVVRFDVNDPRQMAEVVGMGLGYQPMKLTAQWDRIIAEQEAIAFWDIRRESLLTQLWTAKRSGDKDDYRQVIAAVRKFNQDLPPEIRPKAISADTIMRSFQTRAQSAARSEAGTSKANQNVPLVRSIQRLYPEAQVDVRKVR